MLRTTLMLRGVTLDGDCLFSPVACQLASPRGEHPTPRRGALYIKVSIFFWNCCCIISATRTSSINTSTIIPLIRVLLIRVYCLGIYSATTRVNTSTRVLWSKYEYSSTRIILQLTGYTHGLTGPHEYHIRDTYEFY